MCGNRHAEITDLPESGVEGVLAGPAESGIFAARSMRIDILSAVPAVGQVHDYERWSNDWNKFLALFQDPATKQILGWEITRVAAPTDKLDNIEELVAHNYVIQGYMGLNDALATEKTFQALIEAVKAAFRNQHTLGGLCMDAGPLSLEICEARNFGSVLCHYTKLTLPVSEIQ